MRTRAIILKKQNTGEYDQLVTCYTEEFGKLTAVAKSVLKPNSIQAMHLDIFNLVDFELINGRGMPIIAGAQAEETFPRLKNSLQYLAAIYFFAEIIDKLAFEHQKDDELWHFFVLLVGELNNEPQDIKEFMRSKQVEFLSILGYAPNLSECAFCAKAGSGELAVYNVQARGIVCKDCFLGGREGIVIKNNDFLSESVLSGIFESLAEKKLYSLNFLNSVLE